MRHFCTYFDRHYLSRGLALMRSLRSHAKPFRMHVLCMDDAAFETLSRLDMGEAVPIRLGDFEKDDDALLRAKGNRTRIEYYFTCTPSVPLFVLKHNPEVELVTYLDADLFFFSDPAPVYNELGAASVGIIEHRYAANLTGGERTGIYNVGWLSFRRDAHGLEALNWWRERCLEWCYDRAEEGRFADQKYLDDWPSRFSNVRVLQHKGANLAPWNVTNYRLDSGDSKVLVDGQPLIFFHFHNLKRIAPFVYNPNFDNFLVRPTRVLLRDIYRPYLRELIAAGREAARAAPCDAVDIGIRDRIAREPWPKRMYKSVRIIPGVCRGVLQGKYLLVL
jgi:hypothetical protein